MMPNHLMITLLLCSFSLIQCMENSDQQLISAIGENSIVKEEFFYYRRTQIINTEYFPLVVNNSANPHKPYRDEITMPDIVTIAINKRANQKILDLIRPDKAAEQNRIYCVNLIQNLFIIWAIYYCMT